MSCGGHEGRKLSRSDAGRNPGWAERTLLCVLLGRSVHATDVMDSLEASLIFAAIGGERAKLLGGSVQGLAGKN